jgi:hypothetical protein
MDHWSNALLVEYRDCEEEQGERSEQVEHGDWKAENAKTKRQEENAGRNRNEKSKGQTRKASSTKLKLPIAIDNVMCMMPSQRHILQEPVKLELEGRNVPILYQAGLSSSWFTPSMLHPESVGLTLIARFISKIQVSLIPLSSNLMMVLISVACESTSTSTAHIVLVSHISALGRRRRRRRGKQLWPLKHG